MKRQGTRGSFPEIAYRAGTRWRRMPARRAVSRQARSRGGDNRIRLPQSSQDLFGLLKRHFEGFQTVCFGMPPRPFRHLIEGAFGFFDLELEGSDLSGSAIQSRRSGLIADDPFQIGDAL